MGHEHGSLDINRQGMVDDFLVEFTPGFLIDRHVAHVVDQHIDPAELRIGLRRDALNIRQFRYITLHHQGLATHGTHCLRDRLSTRPRAVVMNNNVSAFLCKRIGQNRAKPAP